MNFISIVALNAVILAPVALNPLQAAKPPKYIAVKSCATSPPPCFVTLRTVAAESDPIAPTAEPTAINPMQRIRRGCYDGVGVYLAPCTSKKHIEVQIID